MKSNSRMALAAIGWLVVAAASAPAAERPSDARAAAAQSSSSQQPRRAVRAVRAAPVARYESRIPTQWQDECRRGDVVIVLDTSKVPHGAERFRVEGLRLPGQTETAEIWCDAYGENKSYKDCYSCNSSVPPDVPYKDACDYLGFCTEGYNGNSSYCSFP